MAILWNNRPRRFIIFLHLRIYFLFFFHFFYLFNILKFHDFKKFIEKGNSFRLFLCIMPFFPSTYKREFKKAISLFFHLKPEFFPIEKSFFLKSSAKILWKRSFIFLKNAIAFFLLKIPIFIFIFFYFNILNWQFCEITGRDD